MASATRSSALERVGSTSDQASNARPSPRARRSPRAVEIVDARPSRDPPARRIRRSRASRVSPPRRRSGARPLDDPRGHEVGVAADARQHHRAEGVLEAQPAEEQPGRVLRPRRASRRASRPRRGPARGSSRRPAGSRSPTRRSPRRGRRRRRRAARRGRRSTRSVSRSTPRAARSSRLTRSIGPPWKRMSFISLRPIGVRRVSTCRQVEDQHREDDPQQPGVPAARGICPQSRPARIVGWVCGHLVGDVGAGVGRTDDEHGSVVQLAGSPVLARVQLQDRRVELGGELGDRTASGRRCRWRRRRCRRCTSAAGSVVATVKPPPGRGVEAGRPGPRGAPAGRGAAAYCSR